MHSSLKRALCAFALLTAQALYATAGATTLKPTPASTPLTWQVGTYSYDGSGNIVSISGMSDTYLYDAAGRLAQATANTADHTNSQSFSYDAFGNLLEVDVAIKIGAATPAYGATIMGVDARTNRLTNTAPCNTAGTPACVAASSRGYDAAGNLRGALNGDDYDFDPLNAIIERRGVGGLRQRYLYDANGERVAILYLPPAGSTPSNIDFTLRGASPQVLRVVRVSGTGTSATWSWREDYLYRNDNLLASVVADGTTTGKREHFHLDHLGTPRLITDDRGYRIALHTYWPFGQDAPASDSDSERMKFTGHERDFGFDSERDLDYMHARHYGPLAGRFLSLDPQIGTAEQPQSWNRYAYVRNNPVGQVDPTGRCGESPEFIGPTSPCPPPPPPPAEISLEHAPVDVFVFGSITGSTDTHPASVAAEAVSLVGYNADEGFYLGDIGAVGWEIGGQENYYGTFDGREMTTLDPKPEKIQLREVAVGPEMPYVAGAGAGAGTYTTSNDVGFYVFGTAAAIGQHSSLGFGFSAKPLMKQLARAFERQYLKLQHQAWGGRP